MNELMTSKETMTSLQIAELTGKEHKNVMADIRNIIEQLGSNIGQLRFQPSSYVNSQNKAQSMYELDKKASLLLASGYSVLLRAKIIDRWEELENTQANAIQALSPQLQILINMEVEQKRQAQLIENTNKRIDNISEVVALDSTAWREDARKLINKIALSMGGYEYIKDITADIYRLVDKRAGISLATRLTNKKQRMALEGVCKSKRDKLTKVDVIAEDKKAIEIYLAVVKEMCIKYKTNLAI